MAGELKYQKRNHSCATRIQLVDGNWGPLVRFVSYGDSIPLHAVLASLILVVVLAAAVPIQRRWCHKFKSGLTSPELFPHRDGYFAQFARWLRSLTRLMKEGDIKQDCGLDGAIYLSLSRQLIVVEAGLLIWAVVALVIHSEGQPYTIESTTLANMESVTFHIAVCFIILAGLLATLNWHSTKFQLFSLANLSMIQADKRWPGPG